MRNLFFVAVGAMIIMLSACGKDATVNNQDQGNNTITSNLNDLIGTWNYTTDTVKYYTGSTLDSTKTYSYVNTDNITFNNTGSGTEVRSNVSSAFTFNVINTTLTFNFPKQPGGPTYVNLQQPTGGRALATANYIVTANIQQLTAKNMELVYTTATSSSQSVIESAYFAKQ